MDSIPAEAKRYFSKPDEQGCMDWNGLKRFGRPVWSMWMQRAIWETEYGPIPKQARVVETCDKRGCLTPSHLVLREKVKRVPKTTCKQCGGTLSRDKNNKTYCPQCNRVRTRTWRQDKEGETSKTDTV